MERRDFPPDSDSPGRCPACGVVAPTDAASCPTCGEPLLPADDAPLPPLPDGGLATLMPAWLRDVPASEADGLGAPSADRLAERAVSASAQPASSVGAADPSAAGTSPQPPVATFGAGPAAIVTGPPPSGTARAGSATAQAAAFDPASVITADDVPAWLRAIGAAAEPSVPSAAPPGDPMVEAAPFPASNPPAAPFYVPRVGPRPVVTASGPGETRGPSSGHDAVAATSGPDRANGAESNGRTGLAPDPPANGGHAAAQPTPGDDGALPAPVVERDDPSPAVSGPPSATVTAVSAGDGGTERVAASGGVIHSDVAQRGDSDGPLSDGVAAAIATIAIMIVVAAILFLVWRALAGQ